MDKPNSRLTLCISMDDYAINMGWQPNIDVEFDSNNYASAFVTQADFIDQYKAIIVKELNDIVGKYHSKFLEQQKA